MQIVKNYRHNAALRQSFNTLAEKTFGLNFENWYQNGFWGDCYEPYSAVIDSRVVANVSVNRTDMVIGGQRRCLVQLGTVMTEEGFRNRGFIRSIMEQIEKDCWDADGMYLFGNDSVVEFYPKFGFRPGKEYRYFKTVEQRGEISFVSIPMKKPEDWSVLDRAMKESTIQCGCEMVDNPGLIFFYVTQFMQDCVYYSRELEAYAIAELEDGELLLHNVFAKDEVPLDAVIEGFGPAVQRVTLGFTPKDASGFMVEEQYEEDCNFFVKGRGFADFEEKYLRIPTLSHA